MALGKLWRSVPVLHHQASVNISQPKHFRATAHRFSGKLQHTHSYSKSQKSAMGEQQIEAAKHKAAEKAVEEHFDPSFEYVGIGSGTTIRFVVEAIKNVLPKNSTTKFVPTGYQSRQVIMQAGLTPMLYDSLPENVALEVAFDGADEVDEELNCVKGGGACLFQEKLVATRAKKFVCVADYRKDQSRLLSNWPSVPIEVAPIAVHSVLKSLRVLGSQEPRVRQNVLEKAGPLKTDQDFYIIDARFSPLMLPTDKEEKENGDSGRWEVKGLAQAIKNIPGVLEVGLFVGTNGPEAQGSIGGGQKPIAVYFGMQDGTVKIRRADEALSR